MISIKDLAEGSIDGRQAAQQPASNRVVPKPVPAAQLQDPRRYQLEQLRKRFSPRESTLQNGITTLFFHLKPSDPDFPFELDYLECEVQVPKDYPAAPSTLRVKNKDIPRGFSVNIERGWDRLIEEKQGGTLLALINALDRNLEAFLSEQKVETVKLVAFKDLRHLESAGSVIGDVKAPAPAPAQKPAGPAVSKPYVPEESFSRDQITEAKARRALETKQLESRMGRLSLYQKSADGIVYTLPLEPKRKFDLPVELQSIQSVQLIIPLLYPLQPLRILINDVESKDAEGIEEAFATKAAQQNQMTLTSHINYLTQNIHLLARQVKAAEKAALSAAASAAKAAEDLKGKEVAKEEPEDGRGHIHVIPRPPEWSYQDVSEESESYDDDSWGSDEDESDEGGVLVSPAPSQPLAVQQVERGTAMSFPSIELHAIELLQVSILSLSVKCERCKTFNDLAGLHPGLSKASSCKKCATPFAVKFRQELVHQNSTRAGFIDASGCTVSDMLPSTFTPTCGRCSHVSPGLVSVRGDVITNVCRECHSKFTFKIPEVKFLAYSSESTLPPTSGPRRREEKLGLHAGEPLPGRGTCPHYKRSYRWFRFSCCNKVHPCDKCHDTTEDHPQEWANRMICGWCSREQNYAVESCGFCGRSVIGKKGKGFWEGGKGTRDRTRMSRKDKRKFRRVGGSEATKKD